MLKLLSLFNLQYDTFSGVSAILACYGMIHMFVSNEKYHSTVYTAVHTVPVLYSVQYTVSYSTSGQCRHSIRTLSKENSLQYSNFFNNIFIVYLMQS